MKKYKIYPILAVLAFVLASCVSTKTTSYSDPEYREKAFNSICVYADIDDFETREIIESKLVKELKSMGVNAQKSTDILPPTREWSEEELKNRVMTEKVDCLLKVKLTKTELIDKMGRNSNTYVLSGENAISSDKIKAITKAINANRSFNSDFQSELIDLKSNRLVWSANSNAKSSEAFSNTSNIVISSLVQDIAKELKEKGHLKF